MKKNKAKKTKRTRETVEYKGMKVRILGWGNTFSYWLFQRDGRRIERIAINSGFKSKGRALNAAKQHIGLLAA